MKKIILVLLVTYVVSRSMAVHADYIMPYPSYMPGNALYRISRGVDRLKSYWSWGNIAKIKYHLALSDKYLVEAKTLFEYKQYLLAVDALRRSDGEFAALPRYVSRAMTSGIDIVQLQNTVVSAAHKHGEILTGLLLIVPAEFTWTPEKAPVTQLHLADILKTSADMRRDVAAKTESL